MTSRRRGAGLLAALVILALPAAAQQPWRLVSPDTLVQTGRLTDRLLAEASGAAPSEANPGLIWTIGDSGNPPEVYAVDTTGELRARFRLEGVRNIDWEAIALGPCGNARCLYVADVGDNTERRREVAIHRFREPSRDDPSSISRRAIETLRVRYPDRPHDVEALGVSPDGSALLVTKGRRGGVITFGVHAAAWSQDGLVTATRIDSLPIVPQPGNGRLVSGLAMSPDGRHVVIRTYRELYLFDRSENGRLAPARWTSCDIVGREPQGEAVGWLGDWRLVLLSERGFFAAGTVLMVECRPR